MLKEVVAKFVGARKLMGLCLCVVLLAGLGWYGLRAVRAKDGAARQGGPRLVAGIARVTGVPKAVAAAPLATLTVTSTGDGAANVANCPGANCRLRDAIAKALAGDTINFSVTGTIALTAGELVINKNLTINGPGANLLTISGNNASRVLYINSNVTATLDQLTIANGRVSGSGGTYQGGGVYNSGSVTISNSTISGNALDGSSSNPVAGGGIYNNGGTVMLNNSTLSGNAVESFITGGDLQASAWSYGGGLASSGGSVTITGCTIHGNLLAAYSISPREYGGGIYNTGGSITITSSTLSGHQAGAGGGIYNEGNGDLKLISSTLFGNQAATGGGIHNRDNSTLTLINSTLSGNQGNGQFGYGGGIYNAGGGAVKLINSTIYNNSASSYSLPFFGIPDGGIHNTGSGSTVDAQNTILAGNSPDQALRIFGGLANQGNNLIGGDPKLGPLANNGGPTQTHAMRSSSPARNAGDNCVLTNTCAGFSLPFSLTADQRGTGFPRQFGGVVDIGAFENQVNCPAITVTNPTIATGALDSFFSQTFTQTGVSGTVTFSTSSALPAGLTLASNGTLSGTPSQGGTFPITVTATDSNYCEGTGAIYNLTISCPNTVVTSIADSGAGSLRNAIATACGGGTIIFASGVTGTIALSSGPLVIDKSLAIQGPGTNPLTISGNNAGRVFTVSSGVTASISGLTITGGRTADGAPVDFPSGGSGGDGGGIHNSGTLTLTGVTVSGNQTGKGGNSNFTGGNGGSGGGIFNSGTLTLINSTISGNQTGNGGDGGFTRGNGGNGGGIFNSGTLMLVNSTISSNQTGNSGGGSGGFGGANGSGGGISNSNMANARNTLVAGNTSASGPDVSGTLNSLGYNLIGNTGGATINGTTTGNRLNVNPLLGPLQNNGGPTQTHALLPDSPARDAGDNCVLTNTCASDNLGFNLTTDQRGTGFPRRLGSAADIGAFEAQPLDSTPPDTIIASGPPALTNSTSATFNFSGSDNLTPVESLTYECSLDNANFAPCNATQTFTALGNGPHTLQVRAKDSAGNIDPTPASYTWTIDITPPPAPVVATPANGSLTNNNRPTVTGTAEPNSTVTVFFGSSPAGTTMANGSGDWSFTPSSTLSDGTHTVKARASDAAGNTSGDSTTNTFTVDTLEPDTTLTGTPPAATNSTVAHFQFTGNGTGSALNRFECSLDGALFTVCTSPQSLSGLAEGSHTFRVRAVDNAGNTETTPASHTWVVDLSAPDTTLTSNPPSQSNSGNATFNFMGNDPASGGVASGVAGYECKLDSGAFAACASPKSYTGLADGTHTFQVRAVDAAGNSDATPATYMWTVDATAPDTTITAHPNNPSASANAGFSFTGDDGSGTGVASFQCRLDAGAFNACASPLTLTGLSDGAHTFQVRAVDNVGNADSTPATFTWAVDTTAPETTITANPNHPSGSANASFSFNGADGNGTGIASFRCKLDGGSFTACASPQSYTGLSDGAHTFQVYAVDNAGNTDATPASFTWVVDTAPPDTTISANPSSLSNSANASFSFSGSDPNGSGVAGYECQLDSGGFSTCTSPQTYAGLSDGSHTFQVRALDAANNRDATPATFTWAVDTRAPDTSITAQPAALSNSRSPSFSFNGNDGSGSGVTGFECQLDNGGFSACASPQSYAGLSDGSHTFQVRARDQAGNVDGTPASYTWTIDATPPDTTITLYPPNPSGDTSASFAFTGSDNATPAASLSFECKLDAGAFTTCASPQQFSGLSRSVHTFQVRALDAAGNADPTPASYTWSVNAPPVLTPANLSRAAGSTAANLPLANASDVETPADLLVIQISADGVNFSDSVTAGQVTLALVDQNANAAGRNPTAAGEVSAALTTPCDATVGPLNLYLRVTDADGQTDTKPWTLTITSNPPPVLSYHAQALVAGTTLTINPAAGPSDNGTVGPLVLQSVVPATGLALSLNPVTGQLVVTGATLAGSYAVPVAASDNCGAPTTAGLTVTVVCPTITLLPASLPNGATGEPYAAQSLSALPGGTAYSFAVTQGQLPPGLSLTNGVLSGTPTAAGAFTFTVTASGWGGCNGTRTYTLVVTATCPAITLNPASLPGGTVGSSYNQSLSATGGSGPYTYAVTGGALPGGLTLNAAGSLSGMPTQSGTYSFTATVTGAGGCMGSRSYTLTIACPALNWTPASLPQAQAGVAYTQTVTATGAASYSVQTGNLPSGLALNAATGVLSGMATAAGTYNFTVQATAAGGCSGTRAYTLTVTCPAVTLSPTSLPAGTVNTAYEQSLSATPAGNYSFARTGGSLPPGLTLSAAGVLSGTPTTAGSYTFTVTATGFGTCTGTRQYTVTINAACTTISLPSLPAAGTVGVNYTGNLAGTTPSGSYTFSVESGALPPGLVLDNLFAALVGKPTTAGSYQFTLKATRNNGCMGTRAYTVTINSAAAALAQLGDYDGDGKADLTLWSGASGRWQILRSRDEQTQTPLWGMAGDLTLLGDYDGDGQTDVAVFRPANGTWYVRKSSDGAALVQAWGTATDVPVPGDYDGDGKTDLALWRPGDGNWYVRRSRDGGYTIAAWGLGAAPYLDVPVPGDYDGDGRTDLAVFRRQTGTWLIKRSSDGQFTVKVWGLGSDQPVVGDYDGDGKSDVAVWRGATGQWFVWRSSSQSYAITAWGTAGDVPVVGDYDGDGCADLMVWRAGAQTWYVRCSEDGAVMTKVQGPSNALPAAARQP
jgi:hypothetical protein